MKVTDIINKALKENTTRFAFELLPPLKGDGTDGVFKAVENVITFDPAYINITFHREIQKKIIKDDQRIEWHTFRRRPGTVGIAATLQNRYNIPTVPHIICGGLSRYDIEDALIDMDFLGISNVLALRGDALQNEKHFMPHPEGHSHAVELVKQIKAMNRGEFIDGEVPHCHKSSFSIGVAGYPETHADAVSPDDDILRLKEKIEAGAQYVVTQMFFDNNKYFSFVDKCRKAGINVPIIPGLKPLVNEAQLKSLPDFFSINVPNELRDSIKNCKGDSNRIKKAGLEWSINQAKELKERGVPIIHFYTMSKTESIAAIAKEVF